MTGYSQNTPSAFGEGADFSAKSWDNPLNISGLKNGGRDRDRTCDPYDVNVVLSR